MKLLSEGMLGTLIPELFLHLNNDRHLIYWTPCLESAIEALGLPHMGQAIATYCCSQFLVSRSRIHARNLAFYQQTDRLLREQCWRGVPGCAYPSGDSDQSVPRGHQVPRVFSHASAMHKRPCYVLEFIWHIIFGEAAQLPRREEDSRLPLLLRFTLATSMTLPLP